MSFLEGLFGRGRDKLFDSLTEFGSPRVIDAMRSIPRTAFIHPLTYLKAYEDRVLPIPSRFRLLDNATISQPRVVALMTEMLDPQPDETVLEIGTASGYQAAVLSRLAQRVISVEVMPNLAHQARKRIRRLGIANVDIVLADGSIPVVADASIDKMMITAAVFPYHTPFFLPVLKPGGICVAPIGGEKGKISDCVLTKIRKTDTGYSIEAKLPRYTFVLMQGRAGWNNLLRLYINLLHENFLNPDEE